MFWEESLQSSALKSIVSLPDRVVECTELFELSILMDALAWPGSVATEGRNIINRQPAQSALD